MNAIRRYWRRAALAYAAAALPYLALKGDSMFLFLVAALLAPLGWALVFRSAWAVSGRSRRLLWLFGPAGLAALAPLLATAVLYALWYSNGFGS